MQDQSYDPYTNAQQQAYHGEAQPLAAYGQQSGYPGEIAGGAATTGAYNYQPEYNGAGGEYPPQGYEGYPPAAGAGYAGAGAGLAAGAVGAAALSGGGSHDGHGAVNPVTGLADGMMVRVKVGFVRTLEDELGEFSHFLGDG